MIFDTTGNSKIWESCDAIFLLIKESDIIKKLSSYLLISSEKFKQNEMNLQKCQP